MARAPGGRSVRERERAYIDERLRAVSLDMIQFSGDEDDAALAGWPVPSIRRATAEAGRDVERERRIAADYVLYDAFDAKLFGGTGNRISLDQLRASI